MKPSNLDQLARTVNPILWVLGLVANLAAVITPLLPRAALWMSVLFIAFAVLFWVWILVRRMRLVKVSHRPPTHFHADWDATKYSASVASQTDLALKPAFECLEKLALRLLVADRLETGGWSKTQTWRFVRTGKPLSPVGTLTGTYLAIESLRPYGYLLSSAAQHLFGKLGEIVTADGRVKRQLQLTTSGVKEIVPENLRHSSAWLLLRSSSGGRPTPADRNARLRIATELRGRLEIQESLRGSKEDRDMMGTAFAAAALIAAETWFGGSDSEDRELVRRSIHMFSNSNELSTPGHPSWGTEGGGSAAAETAAHWVTAWLLCSLSDWDGLGAALQSHLADQLLDLIEGSLALKSDPGGLLPYAYSRDSSRAPIGESLLGTGTACYVAMSLSSMLSGLDEARRGDAVVRDLLRRIVARGGNYARTDSLMEPYEGYLAWAALLFALRPVLHPNPLESPKRPDDFWSGAATDLKVDVVREALDRIQRLYDESGATVRPNGLMQDV